MLSKAWALVIAALGAESAETGQCKPANREAQRLAERCDAHGELRIRAAMRWILLTVVVIAAGFAGLRWWALRDCEQQARAHEQPERLCLHVP